MIPWGIFYHLLFQQRPRTILSSEQRRIFRQFFEKSQKPCRKVVLNFIFYFTEITGRAIFKGLIIILSRGKSWQKKQGYHNALFKFGFKINEQRFDSKIEIMK